MPSWLSSWLSWSWNWKSQRLSVWLDFGLCEWTFLLIPFPSSGWEPCGSTCIAPGMALRKSTTSWFGFPFFFSSLFPYVTTTVSESFNNPIAQAAYGVIVLLVSFTNVWMYAELAKMSGTSMTKSMAKSHNRFMAWDIAIKLLGFILTLTFYPPAMMWSVLITALLLVLPRALQEI